MLELPELAPFDTGAAVMNAASRCFPFMVLSLPWWHTRKDNQHQCDSLNLRFISSLREIVINTGRQETFPASRTTCLSHCRTLSESRSPSTILKLDLGAIMSSKFGNFVKIHNPTSVASLPVTVVQVRWQAGFELPSPEALNCVQRSPLLS